MVSTSTFEHEIMQKEKELEAEKTNKIAYKEMALENFNTEEAEDNKREQDKDAR